MRRRCEDRVLESRKGTYHRGADRRDNSGVIETLNGRRGGGESSSLLGRSGYFCGSSQNLAIPVPCRVPSRDNRGPRTLRESEEKRETEGGIIEPLRVTDKRYPAT